ncbi:hypothetical protein P8452_72570 [Trifolium repens]|nr:hypothetical protein P8452_72570 [Trifolium repens]
MKGFTFVTLQIFSHLVPLNKTLIRNGEVEESHRSQPVLQGSQKRNQKAKEASSHFNQRHGSQVFEESEPRNRLRMTEEKKKKN